jgi:uncharacterized protein YbbC (DUF1343 family)/CubicO group peptidase (beta-lactamase class C family)
MFLVAAGVGQPARALAADAAVSQPPSSVVGGIDALVSEALAQNKLPGCVVVVGRASGVVFQKAYGRRALLPAPEPMTLDTIFDLASLTKPLATAASVMVLAEQGKLDLDERVSHYLPAFAGNGKASITVRQLLTHVSGLPADTAVADYALGRAHVMKRIAAVTLKAPVGSKLIYSDLGYLVLEELIRQVTGQDLATFTKAAIFRPLGMTETAFLPPADWRMRVAPTEMRGDAWMRGDVHDPRAFRLGGVAGHAGLFSTARDLAIFARMILGAGQVDGKRILAAATVAKMLAPHDVPGGIRALGWDMQSGYSSNRGTSFSRRAVGHGGYTGTSLWIDPAQDLFVIFLSNRVHPDGKGQVNPLAGAIGTLVGTVLGDADRDAADGPLVLGIDALAEGGFARLRGLRVALLTNDSARTRAGERTTDVLAARKELRIVGLLSPEHGLAANRDEKISDDVDRKTGLPVFSLYGGSHGPRGGRPTGPRPLSLPADIDAVVVDLPDVGARFFTYASTLHATMRAAAERGLRLFVLDRPNPLGGLLLAGPMLKPSEMSPVNHHPLPIRHGMTLGELAEMMNADEHLGLRLEVVRMRNYRRSAYFDETGLVWSPPSPNLRRVEQAVLYPAVALVEATNVSVGRGTDTPFEVVGAPWIDGKLLAQELSSLGLGGVSFSATSFTPTANPHVRSLCQGVRVRIEKRAAFEPVRTGIAIALALRKLYPKPWAAERIHGMIGDPTVTAAILDGKSLPAVEALYKADLEAFRPKRAKYLLYAEPADAAVPMPSK